MPSKSIWIIGISAVVGTALFLVIQALEHSQINFTDLIGAVTGLILVAVITIIISIRRKRSIQKKQIQ